jgi:hypothetical protein
VYWRGLDLLWQGVPHPHQYVGLVHRQWLGGAALTARGSTETFHQANVCRAASHAVV